MLHPRPGQTCALLTPLAKDTELVTFGVCQDNPGLVTLADINPLCTMGHQSNHLGILVIRPEVEMQSAAAGGRRADPPDLVRTPRQPPARAPAVRSRRAGKSAPSIRTAVTAKAAG